jgi:hypothetical protein
MSDQQQPSQETYVDIKESYVNEKLREFFETEKNEVNIDNICLFSAAIVEEYNDLSEQKLKGQQKLEAAVELAKRIVEKTVHFVQEDQRRQVVKNIYYNIETIPQTIEFICRISGNPNLINANKWVLNKAKKIKEEVQKSKVGFFASLCCRKGASPSSQETTPPQEAEPPVDKKKLKEEEKRKKAEERLQRELEELRMTPEERKARDLAVKEEAAKKKLEAEEMKKAAKEAKIQAKKDKEEKKRLEKLRKKELELEQELNKIKSASEKPPVEEPHVEAEPVSEEVVQVEVPSSEE